MSDHRRPLKIFISSPSDVRPERLVAERVVKRLAREFAYHFDVEPVLWEREPLLASHHFQDLIIPPHETDIVVTILWSRLGVPLPSEKYRGAISLTEVTGTEWEFEDAMAGFRSAGQPDLLLYRKLARVTVELGDRAVIEAQQRQAELVEVFMRRWFRSADGGSFTAASWEFRDTGQFETQLEDHLRSLLRKRLTGPSDVETPATITWHQGSPYRGLESFELEHAPVFFGRTTARHEVREALARQIVGGSAFVAVVGGSGSGKSSLVKAAVLPDLLMPGMIGNVAFCRYAVIKPGAGKGPAIDALRALADALLGPTALPEMAAAPLHYDCGGLARLLEQAPAMASQPIRQGLSAAGAEAGVTARGEARLVLVLDQLEELFTASIQPETRERFAVAVAALARSGLVWVLTTLRSDFYDRIATSPTLAGLCAGDGTYLLTPPDPTEIGQVIRRPAREAGLRFEVASRSEQGLDDAIRDAAERNPDSLPLLSYLLDQLWQRRTEHGFLTFAAYEGLGGLEGAIGRRAEEVLASLPEDVRAAFPSVLRSLVTLSGASATATARRVPLAQFPEGGPGRRLIEAFAAPDARIVTLDRGDSGARVRVAHEALLTHWERARLQITADRRDIRARARLEEYEGRWREAQPADRSSLLLAPGLPLSEAEDLAGRRGDELEPSLHAFVAASSTAAREAARRRLRVRNRALLALGALAFLAITMAGFGFWKWQGQLDANRQTETVRRLARQNGNHNAPGARSLLLSIYASELSRGAGPEHDLDALEGLRQQLDTTGGYPLLGHDKPVHAAAFSADGRWLATGDDKGDVRLWDMSAVDPAAASTLIGSQHGQVAGLSFSPDGTWLASGGADGALHLYRNGTNGFEEAPSPERPRAPISSLQISPTGEWLAFAAKDGQVCRWRLSREGLTATPCQAVQLDLGLGTLVFSQKGRWLAGMSGGEEGKVYLWNLADADAASAPLVLRHRTPLLEPYLQAIALSADETRLAAAYGYATEIWDLTQPDPAAHVIRRLGYSTWVAALDFSPDGRWLAIAGAGVNAVDLWDLRDAQDEPISLKGPLGGVSKTSFNANSRWIVGGGYDGTVHLWDLQYGAGFADRLLRGQEQPVTGLLLAPGGSQFRLVAIGDDRAPRLWSFPGTTADPILFFASGQAVMAASFSPDGKWIASSERTGDPAGQNVLIWSTADPRAPVRRLRAGLVADQIVFSPTGRWLAAAANGGHRVLLWDLAATEPSAAVLALDSNFGPRSLGFSPDGKWLLAGTYSKPSWLSLWALEGDHPSLQPVKKCPWPMPLYGVAFTPDGTKAVTGGWPPAAQWDLSSNDPCSHPLNIGGHKDQVVDVQISPDGHWLAMASFDHVGRLYALGGGSEPKLVTEAKFKDRVFAARFSPDGRWAAFASWDKTAQLFDLATLAGRGPGAVNESIVLTGHNARLLALEFSPDGRWLATASEDHTVRLWDLANPKLPPVALAGHDGGVLGVRFLPDRRVFSYGVDGKILIWQSNVNELSAVACRVAGRTLTPQEIQDYIGPVAANLPCVSKVPTAAPPG